MRACELSKPAHELVVELEGVTGDAAEVDDIEGRLDAVLLEDAFGGALVGDEEMMLLLVVKPR